MKSFSLHLVLALAALLFSTTSVKSQCFVDAGNDTTFCQQQGQLFATPLFSSPNYVYSWSPAAGLNNPNTQNPLVITGVSNQTYVVTMTDTVGGCTTSDSVTVSAYYFQIDTVYSCFPDSFLLDFGPGATNYFWQFFTDTNSVLSLLNVSTQTYWATEPGTYAGYATFTGCGALTSVIYVEDSCSSFTCGVDAGPDTTFCQLQGQLNATPASPGNYTFSWSPSFGLSNANIQNPAVVAGVNNQQYIVTMTDGANNCVTSDTIIVSAFYWHIDTVYICNGNPVTYDLGPGAMQYTTQFTDTLGNFQSYILPNELLVMTQPGTYLCIGFYPGCGALTSLITAIDSCSVQVPNVWPGDCNYDLVVNMADALHIGLAYGATGATRPNASNLWYAQPMIDWSQNYVNCNYKHGDADGNGIVNVNDTLPISLNYSLTHPFRLGAPQVSATAPTLQLFCSVDTVGLQTLVQVDVLLGANTLTVDSLYGISFRITSDAGLIDTTLTVLNANTSWLGNDGVDMFTFRKQFQSAAAVDFAEVRNDHVNRLNGSGQIASYFIVTTDNLSGIAVCHFNISDVTAVTASQQYVQFATVNDSVVIDPIVPAGISSVEQPIQFNMYPNPANDAVIIQTGGTATQIEICDMTGRVVEAVQPISNTSQLETSLLAAGMYFVRVTNGTNVSTQKLTISR